MTQITFAVSYLHEKNIIHCDITPKNILIDSNLNAFLSDFGLSKFFRDSFSSTKRGTPLYSPPEFIIQNETKNYQYKKEGDIFSLLYSFYKIYFNLFENILIYQLVKN